MLDSCNINDGLMLFEEFEVIKFVKCYKKMEFIKLGRSLSCLFVDLCLVKMVFMVDGLGVLCEVIIIVVVLLI